MSKIRINSISVKNYRSFGNDVQTFSFPNEGYKKPVAIVGYNNSGKTNLMNAIKYGLYDSVREDTFELKDFHNCNWDNPPNFKLNFTADIGDDKILTDKSYNNISELTVKNNKIIRAIDVCDCYSNCGYGKKWVIKQNAPIFYINFHNIKEEISTQKTSWGNLKSFLAKHIKKIVDNDTAMKGKRDAFQIETKKATSEVLKDSKLNEFIAKIKTNYSINLRDNNCEIDFCLPGYEEIFLQMMFKIGLNGCKDTLVPISHFGDGYISMFVMAVIKAIAESNTNDKCLFLFEEPESFLHENHQEYFYKVVLCNLAEQGHQVIYTTHSDKMVDIFDTKGLIRIEFDDEKKQTVKKYNNTGEFSPNLMADAGTGELITLGKYNDFVKTIEPNLNRILFSKKVVLVEGPNDVMAYRYAIEKKIQSLGTDSKYAKNYLNFNNIAIIPHHGKSTAFLLIQLCKHIGLDYFVINDSDSEANTIGTLSNFATEEALKSDELYIKENGAERPSKSRGVVTTNWKLIHYAGKEKIHFNIPKLEGVLGEDFDKDSLKLWKILEAKNYFEENFFPKNLDIFLELDKILLK